MEELELRNINLLEAARRAKVKSQVPREFYLCNFWLIDKVTKSYSGRVVRKMVRSNVPIRTFINIMEQKINKNLMISKQTLIITGWTNIFTEGSGYPVFLTEKEYESWKIHKAY
jgi:hypothetical protein